MDNKALESAKPLPGRDDYFVWGKDDVQWETVPTEPPELEDKEAAPRPTGKEIFDAKSKAEQDEALGPLPAQMVREGRIKLSELVQHEELDSDTASIITQKPVEKLIATDN